MMEPGTKKWRVLREHGKMRRMLAELLTPNAGLFPDLKAEVQRLLDEIEGVDEDYDRDRIAFIEACNRVGRPAVVAHLRRFNVERLQYLSADDRRKLLRSIYEDPNA